MNTFFNSNPVILPNKNSLDNLYDNAYEKVSINSIKRACLTIFPILSTIMSLGVILLFKKNELKAVFKLGRKGYYFKAHPLKLNPYNEVDNKEKRLEILKTNLEKINAVLKRLNPMGTKEIYSPRSEINEEIDKLKIDILNEKIERLKQDVNYGEQAIKLIEDPENFFVFIEETTKDFFNLKNCTAEDLIPTYEGILSYIQQNKNELFHTAKERYKELAKENLNPALEAHLYACHVAFDKIASE